MTLLEQVREKVAKEKADAEEKARKYEAEREEIQQRIIELIKSMGFTDIAVEGVDTGRRDVVFRIGDARLVNPTSPYNMSGIVGIFSGNQVQFLPPQVVRDNERIGWTYCEHLHDLPAIIERSVTEMVRRGYA
jgi:hypothetical protein